MIYALNSKNYTKYTNYIMKNFKLVKTKRSSCNANEKEKKKSSEVLVDRKQGHKIELQQLFQKA